VSERNLEAARTAIAAMSEGDVEAYASVCAPDVELITAFAAFEGGYRGEQGLRDFFASVRDAASSVHYETEELRAVGPDRVLAFLHLTAESRAGMKVDQRIANVYDCEDGKLVRVRVYLDRDEALRDAGQEHTEES
jgi:ketosteroid isomerase-like protein